jgi:hypothetical protein
MKLASYTLRVALDDGLPVADVRAHLEAVLQERGTEIMPARPNGGAEGQAALPTDLPRQFRVHWSTVEVVQAVERQAPSPPPARKHRRTSAAP